MNDLTTQLTTTIAAFVLSSSSGLRAYLPIFALGLAGALGIPSQQTAHMALGQSYGILTNPIVLVVLGILSVLEIVADKIPGVDHVSDAIHTAIRPVMGALIFAGTNNVVSHQSPLLAGALGLVLAGGVHATKALAVRPVTTATTAGIGNPVVSIIEDIISVASVVLAIFVPVVALILFIIFIVLFVLLFRRILRRRREKWLQKELARRGQSVQSG